MNRLTLFLACVTIAACGGNGPVQPAVDASTVEAPALAKAPAPTPVYTCASADVSLRSLITYVQNSTHVQAPATEAVLLPPLYAAHAALVATPCDKQGALSAMAAFNAAVNATASTVTATQAFMFRLLANRVISAINLVP